MRRLYFFLFVLVLWGGQTIQAQSIQKSLEQNDDIQMVIITKDMFSIINEVNNHPDRKKFYEQLNYMGTFSGSSTSVKKIQSVASKYIADKQMKLLLKAKKTDRTATIYYLPSSRPGFAKELLITIFYPQEMKIKLYHVTGNINLKKITFLALQSTQLDYDILKQAEQKTP